MAKNEEKFFRGTGRRKRAVARVRIKEGKGKVEVNGKELTEYFNDKTSEIAVKQPLVITKLDGKIDIIANVKGGGQSGQAEAIRHGVSRALLELNPDLRPALKKEGFLTRDPRMKERKKYGLKKARKAPQFSKR